MEEIEGPGSAQPPSDDDNGSNGSGPDGSGRPPIFPPEGVLDEVRQGEAMGFGTVFSGPLVRSSYRADEQRHAAETGRGAVAY